MTALDVIFLLGTGLIGLYLLQNLYRAYISQHTRFYLYYLTAFAILVIAGVVLIFAGYGVLSAPLIVAVTTLLPLFLSLGLVTEFYPRFEQLYRWFAAVGWIGIVLTRAFETGGWETVILATVHSIAGLLIFGIPIIAAQGKSAEKKTLWVTVGGFLIGVGGIALAFLKAGAPILSEQTILAILAPLLFLMTLAFTIGLKRNPAMN